LPGDESQVAAAAARRAQPASITARDEVAQGDVDAAIDAIRRRYGAAAVGPAAVLGRGGLRVKELGDSQWGPAPAPPPDEPS
jgi:hypothetical protein